MKHSVRNESGVVLITVLLIMLVLTVMMLGFYFMTTGEQKLAASDRNNTVAYYGAMGGLEKMSSDLASLFVETASPTPAQITNLTTASYQPSIPNITFPSGGYTITYTTNAQGQLTSAVGTIGGNGPLAGLTGILTPLTLTVIADGPYNTEVKITRVVQEVAVPIWQFGIFSNGDLSFFASPNFGFGGRTHTNGNLFLAQGAGNILTLNDKVTAFQNIIVTQLSNGQPVANNGSTGTIDVTTGAAGGCPTPTCQALTEGSVVGGPGSAAEPDWQTVSITNFAGNIRSGTTGAQQLNLALAFAGAAPIAMAQRPPLPPAPADNATLARERFFNLASVRILLSDTQADITGLPGIDTTVNPYPLAEVGSTGAEPASGDATTIQRTSSGAAYYLPATDACHPPLAESFGYVSDPNYLSPAGTTLLGGYIKIEVQQASGAWKDVTQEVLSLGVMSGVGGMAAPGLTAATTGGSFPKSTTYYYVVTALGPWGENQGTEANITTGSTTSTNKIKLTWTAVTGATGYRVYRGTSAGGETGYLSQAAGTTSYTDTNGTALTAGTPPAACKNISVVQLEEAGPHYSTATTATSYIPLNLYDPREGELRDTNTFTTSVALNGVMNLVQLNVGNLQKWLANTLCTASTVPTSCPSGALAVNNSGYTLYFSDRRGNKNSSGNETGEYGYEDSINPQNANGAPNGILDTGEDVDGDGILETYGGTPYPLAVDPSAAPSSFSYTTLTGTTSTATPQGFINLFPAAGTATPFTRVTATEAEVNSVIFFRRALRLINGTVGNLPPLAQANCSSNTAGGFTVTAENPIYVQGDYNANANGTGGFTDTANQCHVPAAVLGDAVTVLSNSWQDINSFNNPTNPGGRSGSTSWYRMAVMAGKNNSFPNPTYSPAPRADFGTDGGAHNFLRMIENWATLNYRGSMASFYTSVQATGVYKYTVVYGAPTRAFAFDTDFQNIALLPPSTPRFTDVNALSYQQAVLASQ
jgi:PilX N-terminal